MDLRYGNVIWTHHALERLIERGITQEAAWATFQHSDQSRFAATKDAWVYYKTYGNERIEVVAKQNEHKEWIILSVWSKPVWGKSVEGKSFVESFWAQLKRLIFGR